MYSKHPEKQEIHQSCYILLLYISEQYFSHHIHYLPALIFFFPTVDTPATCCLVRGARGSASSTKEDPPSAITCVVCETPALCVLEIRFTVTCINFALVQINALIRIRMSTQSCLEPWLLEDRQKVVLLDILLKWNRRQDVTSSKDWNLSISIYLVDDVANLGRHANTLTERKSRTFALLWTPPPHVQPDVFFLGHFSPENMFHPGIDITSL